MSAFSIRKATRQDAPEIARIHVASWRAAYRGLMPAELLNALDASAKAEAWKRVLSDGECSCYIAALGDEAIGFVHVSPGRDGDREPSVTGEITAIYLDPRFWRRGYGSELMERALEGLRGKGHTEVVLWVLEDHASARKFYEGFGFVADGERKAHPKSGLIEVRYARRIQEHGI